MSLDKTKTQNSPFDIGLTVSVPTLRQTFNTSQNWTVPAGIYGIWVALAGGGAGGNARITGNNSNGSGGGGGNGLFSYTPVTPGSTVGITIGAGGTGGTSGATSVDSIYGNEGGTTIVNTVGASWYAPGAARSNTVNTVNSLTPLSFSGKIPGTLRQPIVFGPKSNSPRLNPLFIYSEGVSIGGQNSQQDVNGTLNSTGSGSVYGGGSGGFASTNLAVNNATAGGSNFAFLYSGGAGQVSNTGAGGGGAGITGNGAAGSAGVGGAGGAGGGGGGGGRNDTGVSGGAGGAGAVLIYY